MIEQYMSEVAKKPRLTREQERTATPAELVECNLRLVVRIAHRWRPRNEHDLMDRIQDGNIGLMVAAQKYDGSRGIKFSTYAGHWINHHIRYALRRQERVVKPTERGLDALPTVIQQAASGVKPHEIAQAVDLPVDEVQWIIGGDYEELDEVAHDEDLDLVHVLAKARRVLDELSATVMDLYLQGHSAPEIGRKVKCHRVTVENIKARNIEALSTHKSTGDRS